ncbi:MAG: tRNA pseudouridine(55) synthase TruB [Ignavibacteria bacterium GWF2_33_9]|nr:MAG: tRNA pseudouridine(55) synthase TruB [Ignavibacteria bacterium GWF2_33_9]
MPDEGGLILIDKDEGWTSFDIIRKLRNLLKIKKIGHAGTLDPLATGLMIVAVGKATKQLNFIQNDDKQYTGLIKLGASTPSYDRETEESEFADISDLDEKVILANRDNFLGELEQFPPVYSAVKYQGKRAYEFARKKIDIELQPRNVTIFQFEILSLDNPFLEFKIDVSKGFYVRTFAFDFGHSLRIPSYLYSLKRTRVGEYFLKDAVKLDEIEDLLAK